MGKKISITKKGDRQRQTPKEQVKNVFSKKTNKQ